MRLAETFPVSTQALYSVMSTVHYFDIFKHPLREVELQDLVHIHALTDIEFGATLSFLVRNNFLFEKDGYYLPHNSYENIDRRIKGFELSEKLWSKALRKSKLISRFPFTRCVLISGSLSKGYMDAKSDIDYLIITKPGRLWLARTLLVLYKKIFLLNSHKFFCVNYFLDQNNLILTDKNLFTATELMFAKPVYNIEMYLKFLEANPWTREYYPAMQIAPVSTTDLSTKTSWIKKISEALLNGKFGDYLDQKCMKISDKFWKRKFKQMNHEQFIRDMKTDKGVSKHHPNGFRDKILHDHQQRMEAFTKKLHLYRETILPVSQHVYES